jgi:CheY-like chemotaxis protein
MLSALLLSQDAETLQVLRRVLDECRVKHESCPTPAACLQALGKRKFDAIVVDCDHGSGKTVLKQVRETPAHKRAITFAIIGNGTSVQEAFAMGANFVLDKPMSAERASRTVRAAQGLMIRERRRYFRHRVKVAVSLFLASGQEIKAMLANLSETGLAVESPHHFEANTPVRVRFTLPTTHSVIEAKAEIAWQKAKQSGIRFLQVEQKYQRDLEQWLAKRFESARSAPLFINATAGKH